MDDDATQQREAASALRRYTAAGIFPLDPDDPQQGRIGHNLQRAIVLAAARDALEEVADQMLDDRTYRRAVGMRTTIARLEALTGTMQGSERARALFDDALHDVLETYVTTKLTAQEQMDIAFARLVALPLDRAEAIPVAAPRPWWRRLLGV